MHIVGHFLKSVVLSFVCFYYCVVNLPSLVNGFLKQYLQVQERPGLVHCLPRSLQGGIPFDLCKLPPH